MSGDKGRAAAGKGVECEAEGRGRVSRAAASRRLRLRRGAAGCAVRGARGDSVGAAPLPRSLGAARGRRRGVEVRRQLAWECEGGPRVEGSPRGVLGGTAGVHFSLLSLKFYPPAALGVLLKAPRDPSSRCLGVS